MLCIELWLKGNYYFLVESCSSLSESLLKLASCFSSLLTLVMFSPDFVIFRQKKSQPEQGSPRPTTRMGRANHQNAKTAVSRK
jgi:hypothetical protein